MVKVLFVCMGNICRSPTAEAVFRHYVENAGLAGHILIDSAARMITTSAMRRICARSVQHNSGGMT